MPSFYSKSCRPGAIILFFLLLSAIPSYAQNIFQKTYGDSVTDYAITGGITKDGGYFIAGETASPLNQYDFYLVKTDINGNFQWGKSYGDTALNYLNDGKQTFDGGFILVGSTTQTGAGSEDFYVIKTDGNGNVVWAKTYGGTLQDDAFSVQQTTDSAFVVTGFTRSFGAGGEDVLLIKIDQSGNVIWSKTYGHNGTDEPRHIQQTKDNGFIIAGVIWYPLGTYDCYLIKTDMNGNLEWSKSYGDTGINKYDYLNFAQQTKDNGYILAGVTGSFGVNQWDGYLLKTDSLGNLTWSKTYGNINYDYLYNAEETTDGDYILSYSSNGPNLSTPFGSLIKTNSVGDTIWTRSYAILNNSNGIYIAHETSDGGYVALGVTKSTFGSDDILFVKTDSMGNSGCNEKQDTIIITSPPTIETVQTTLVSNPVVIAANYITPVTSRGSGYTLCSSVGIREQHAEMPFQIFPNPISIANNKLMIRINEIQQSKILLEIFNLTGEKIISEKLGDETEQVVALKNTSPGIYFVKITDGDKHYIQKIIIQ